MIAISIPDDLPTSTAVAVDGTAKETWARTRRPFTDNDYDGDEPRDADTDPARHTTTIAKRRAAYQRTHRWPTGPDGRAISTADPDARGGYKTATNRDPATLYNGYEAHLAVAVRDGRWAGDPGRYHLGPDVPAVIRTATLVPAGSHRGDAIIPGLLQHADRIDTVIWDRAYSILPLDKAQGPLRRAGISTVFDLTQAERRYPAVHHNVIFLDGHPFHPATPEHLRALPAIPRNSSAAERARHQAAFNERARWRYSQHARPDADLYTRWRCPFCTGRLKARTIKQNKIAATAPLVELPTSTTTCCTGTISLSASYLRHIQADGVPYGTTAHAQSYGRRNIVETANSQIDGKYASYDRNYTPLFGLGNNRFLLGFLLAAYNYDLARAWRRRQEAEQRTHLAGIKQQRRKRRLDTYRGTEPRHDTARRPTPALSRAPIALPPRRDPLTGAGPP